MKKTKKIIGLLLVLAMAISMTIPAFAANDGKIIIDNPQTGEEYTAYKIFDVVYDKTDANNETYAYTIIGGDGADKSPWFDVVATYAGENKGLSIYEAAGSADTYVVTFDSTFHAADLAEYLAKAVRDGNVTDNSKKTFAKVGETREVTGLELGYYLVTGTSTDTVCNLTTTNPEVTIHDKNEVPTITKKYTTKDSTTNADDKFVEVGEIINFTIEGEYPNTEGYAEYFYKLEDNMSPNMTFNGDVVAKIKRGDQVIELGSIVGEEGYVANTNGFSFEIDLVEVYEANDGYVAAGDMFIVEYSATVNETALDNPVLENEAKLTYSNDPNNPDKTETDPTAEIITLYSAKIDVDKYVTGNLSKKLAGATFKLYKKDGDNKLYYVNTNNTITWAAQGGTEYTTNDLGEVVFAGLGDGTYYLEETAAPTGYNLLKDAIEVVISDDTVTDATVEDGIVSGSGVYSVAVANSKGALLPSTGGIGTYIFYILGTILIAGAFILIVTKKRMSTEK